MNLFADALGSGERPGAPAATEEHLSVAEKRLKITLPRSYRVFLLTSNGWRNASREVPVLRPVEKVRWFKNEHRDWVQAYTGPMQALAALLPAERDYFNYGQDDSVHFDAKHLAYTLCISDVGDDAVLLLNPMVVWPDGEWETWLFANWLPGATRYRSFADWMRHQLAGLRDETFVHSIVPGELPTVYLDGPARPKRRVRPREEVLTFDEVLKRLSSKTRSRRIKAVRQLCRIGDQQAIGTLLELLKNDYDYHVRCETAELLGLMRVEAAIAPLLELTAETSYVTSTAIEALGNFKDEVTAQRLLTLIEEDGPSAGVAAYAMARRNDPRAVPLLVQKLLSNDPRDRHTGEIAGSFISEFEEPGYLALEPLAACEYREIRRRAIKGLFNLACLAKDKQLKIRARNLLERRLETEPDPGLRENLKVCVAVAGNKKPPGSDNPFSAI